MARGGLIAFSVFSLLSPSALADPAQVDLRQFNPPVDPGASLALEPTNTPGAGNWHAAVYSSYAYRLLVLADTEGTERSVPIRHQSSLDLVLGTGLGERFALGLVLPAAIYQTGTDNTSGVVEVPQSGLGDPIVEGKVSLVPRGPLGGFGLAALARGNLPLGSRDAGVGDHGWVGQLSVLSELDLVVASLRAEVGFRARSESALLGQDEFGNTIPFAVGLALRPQTLGLDSQGRWLWFVETHGRLAAAPEFGRAQASPAVIGMGARYNLGSDVSLLGGAELPLSTAVGVPAVRGVIGLTYAPRFADADKDGIADEVDDCPEGMPEDRDGFEDDDGCPDEDNDMDGVSDAEDRCPATAEDQDGYQDTDGCLDPDNDGDGVLDTDDACPMVRGVPSKSKKHAGCPPQDTDNDGVNDDVDQCSTRAEDRDGIRDDDGCPDLDDDGDGVRDPSDACPTERGARRVVAALNGCPDPDLDNDTFFGVYGDDLAPTELSELAPGTTGAPRDACPLEAEDFDSDRDGDGCPDLPNPPKTVAPIQIQLGDTGGIVHFARSPVASQKSPWPATPAQWEAWRALGHELRLHPDWTARIVVLPKSSSPEDQRRSREDATRLCRTVDLFTLRPGSARPLPYVPPTDTPTKPSTASQAPVTVPTPVGVSITWPASRHRGEATPSTVAPPAGAPPLPIALPAPRKPKSPKPAESAAEPGSPVVPGAEPAPAPGAPASPPSASSPERAPAPRALPAPIRIPRDTLAPQRPPSVLPKHRIPR